jgi:hypothetical protein
MPATKVFAGMARSYTPKLLSFLTHIGIRHCCSNATQKGLSTVLFCF